MLLSLKGVKDETSTGYVLAFYRLDAWTLCREVPGRRRHTRCGFASGVGDEMTKENEMMECEHVPTMGKSFIECETCGAKLFEYRDNSPEALAAKEDIKRRLGARAVVGRYPWQGNPL
jgi:hypothetical protein